MSIGDFLGRVGDSFSKAPPEAWFSLAQALTSNHSPLVGLSQGLSGFGQQVEAGKKKASLADALQGAMGGMSPQQQTVFGALAQADPYKATELATAQMFKPAPEKPNDIREYEFAKAQGFNGTFMDYQTELRRSGASNTTINNLPAEVGARIALGEGFVNQFEDIKRRAKDFYSGGPGEQIKRRGQMFFNTGEGGKLWRDVETGKEALIRGLTGSGMGMAEAENQASRYSLSPFDSDFDALSKLDGLYRDLNNVAAGAYRAKGGNYTPPKSNVPKDHSDVDAILGIK